MPDSTAEQREHFEAVRRDLVRNRSLHRLLRGREHWSDAEEDVAQLHVRLYQAIETVADNPLIVDASKSPVYGLFLTELDAIDVRVIQLVRDSRAVAYSWQRDKEWSSSSAEHTQMMRTRKPAAAAREWVSYNAFGDVLRGRHSPSILVRYEDLADDPDDTVHKIVEALDLPQHDPSPTGSGHGFLGNPMRFDTGPVTVTRDDEWKSELSRSDRVITTALTGPQLLRYGYRP